MAVEAVAGQIQEEKHEEIVNILTKLHNPEDGGEVSTLCFKHY